MRVGVIGGGSWGTALAFVLNKNNHNTYVWCYDKKETEYIILSGENKKYLPGIKIPKSIIFTNNITDAINNSNMLILAVPSIFIRKTMENIKPYLNNEQIIVVASKGIEENTLLTLSQIVQEVVPYCKVGVLSGPTHAEEVAKEIPTACVASSKYDVVSKYIQEAFMNPYFRVYTNNDIIGVEVGAALKNVIALAGGISDGLGYGDNTKAALITRGIKEIARLGVCMGADVNTFSGLTGIGDLIVTCTSMHSRNRRAGILLGKGRTLEETLQEVGMVVEGVNTVKAAYSLLQKYNIEMPIVEEINNILVNNKSPRKAVQDLMTREKTTEYKY